MKRNTLNFTIDLLAFTACIGLITTAFIMRFILPPGSGGQGRLTHDGRGAEHIKTLLSMGRHDWGDIHFYFAIGFVLLLTIHLILHFDWIKNSCKKLFRSA